MECGGNSDSRRRDWAYKQNGSLVDIKGAYTEPIISRCSSQVALSPASSRWDTLLQPIAAGTRTGREESTETAMVQHQPQPASGQANPAFLLVCRGKEGFQLHALLEFFFLIWMSPSAVWAGAGWQLQSKLTSLYRVWCNTSAGIPRAQSCRSLHYPWHHRALRIKSCYWTAAFTAGYQGGTFSHLLCFFSSKTLTEFWQIFSEKRDSLLLQKGRCETRLPGHIPNIYILPFKVHFCCQIQPHCSSSSQKYKTA